MTDGNGTAVNISDDLEIIKTGYLKRNAVDRLKIAPDLSGIDEWFK
jgi:hypothetical protein